MLIKTGRFGKFLSCSDYPTCKTSRPIVVKLGLTCPKCEQGELVEKKGRSGRPFYGCNRYPDCDWVAWQRPLADPCPDCGKLRVPIGKDKIHCLGCDGPMPQRERRESADGAAKGGRRNGRAVASADGADTTATARGTRRPATGRTATAKTRTTTAVRTKATKTASPKAAGKPATGRKAAASKSPTTRTRRAS
jgi:hypothetical protein